MDKILISRNTDKVHSNKAPSTGDAIKKDG